ncbi:MAG: S-methyl-5-thioribose-1-phosphate isomerase [Leptospiraceae bacterium]|nr:S-methyl-5-thioribose-1-phosphate isomerase [Leptospiraceae bacterium]
MSHNSNVEPIIWSKDAILLLDQRKLPAIQEYVELYNLEEVTDAIRNMTVRGAPAIAVAGLCGLSLFLKEIPQKPSREEVEKACEFLLSSRPTAVNLKLAVEHFKSRILLNYENLPIKEIIQIADKIADDYIDNDRKDNIAIGKNGLSLFQGKKKLSILTHCNPGALGTTGYGTALGIVRALRDSGCEVTVYVDETRPFLQGSRLTAWEMQKEKIEYYIITDNMAGWLFTDRKIDAVIVGCDRIASNGDTANKIGTYPLSIIAREHDVPFYIAGTQSSFDFSISDGKKIQIEMRSEDEVTEYSFMKNLEGGSYFDEGLFSPSGARALNPAFDVTPAKNITAIVTEKGVITPVSEENIRKIMPS